MTYILKDIIKGGAGAIINVPVIYKILNNPVIIAVLVTLLMLLITMFVYNVDKGVKNILKTTFYMFLVNFGILLFYNHVIDKEWKDRQITGGDRMLLNDTAEISGGDNNDEFTAFDLQQYNDNVVENIDEIPLIIPDSEPIPSLLISDSY